MKPFKKLSAIAAPLPMINVDTDVIIPKQFLRTIKRSGLGKSAFFDIRYNEDGSEKPDFVLNKPAYRNAEILITGANFGCGSSREHAPWALLDFGIRCVIAASYSDIFYSNCFKNGILPVILPQAQIDELMKEAEENPGAPIEVDLEKQVVTRGNKFSFPFEVDSFRKHCLVNGLDDIGLTLQKEAHISSFEKDTKSKRPWI
ncbi:MAG TPA: 3-isopropylmalate dehydratase small subunit [Alphaproteobacteria bacterium]|nr:3-isopropylmalate dehydratase small subunit [Micavibrio sp.]MBK9563228.1 3-isopropylmalate dehydratase small subunit [Micavibrio sp.]HQX27946.1 3-isopropylmalate dehydratase small subunit [Alphaproteobacteria bacterium]